MYPILFWEEGNYIILRHKHKSAILVAKIIEVNLQDKTVTFEHQKVRDDFEPSEETVGFTSIFESMGRASKFVYTESIENIEDI